MATKRSRNSPGNEGPPRLLAPRAKVAAELGDRVHEGEAILNRDIQTREDIKQLRADFYSWSDYNDRLLRARFSSAEVADSYSNVGGSYTMDPTPDEEVNELHRDLADAIRRMTSIRQQLSLFEEPSTSKEAPSSGRERVDRSHSRDVFIVHGHDTGRKDEVARFIDHIGLKPVVLHEQPNSGRTLIEKFERHASEVGYAIVLLTADDKGGRADGSSQAARARQNVVFELGFFFGRLGRDRVTVLYEKGVEQPSDVNGIAYVALEGDWKLQLVKELTGAGLEIDYAKLAK